ncbi:MAG: OmpH family outer membrane protein [Acidobacteria bacterium]|nr:OmpH family outer membrane protein [Acidobacteriota bacterium]MBA3884488.1 OmpH family outer membrane protein [Acidobacteriota bacterium]
MIVIVALGFVLVAGPAIAQGTAGQQPPATPPAAQAPAPKPEAPVPFPEGAKVAYVIVQLIADSSSQGKAATARLQGLEKKLTEQIQERFKALEASRTKLQQGGSVMSPQAVSQLQKEIEKQERDLQFAQQDAQNELNELRQDLLEEFQERLNPVLEEIRREKGLHMIFSAGDGGLAAADPGLNISGEVIKRLDAAKPAAPAEKK